MTQEERDEVSSLVQVTGGTAEEQAAAIAVISALIEQIHSSQSELAPGWRGKNAFREGLKGTWRSQITI